MWPFSKKQRFPGVKVNTNGTIDFSLTAEERLEVDLAFQAFKGLYAHPDYSEKITNGIRAVALSRYAKNLVDVHIGVTKKEFKSNWSAIQRDLEKAVAAVWKSYSLYPLPIFLYHRAVLLPSLGLRDESLKLFALFLKEHAEFKMDQMDKLLIEYEGTDLNLALSNAKREV